MISATTLAPSFAHLSALTDDRGVFEHAEFDVARREHGYCVDDVARALIVVSREPDQTPELARLAETYLTFLEKALQADGGFHNRMAESGVLTDVPGTGDWWGRGIWALGELFALTSSTEHRRRSARAFAVASTARSADVRAMAFAGLGAAAIVQSDGTHYAARALLEDSAAAVGAAHVAAWSWPEDRLRYANASLAQVLIVAGSQLGRRDHLERGLGLLRFLVSVETAGDRLSVTGTGGRGPDEVGRRQFDQQPIEPAAIAEACACAFEVTADPTWLVGLERAWGWFVGRNDVGVSLFDRSTGAGFDGLHRAGRNENRGAESTIAALTTYQLARRFGVLD
jgi:hypothetical protein